MDLIIHNRIRCRKCGEIIESVTVHDFKWCSCGPVAVAGGKDYLRRCGNIEDYENLSEIRQESEYNINEFDFRSKNQTHFLFILSNRSEQILLLEDRKNIHRPVPGESSYIATAI